MKKLCKIVLFISFFCSSLLMMGQEETYQEFAPIGATWHYNHGIEVNSYGGVSDIEQAYFTLTAVGDTIIAGKTIRMVQEQFTHSWISGQMFDLPSNHWLYFYQDGGKVYQTNKQASYFSLLYDFSAQIGDTWQIGSDLMGNYSESCSEVQVHAIDTLTVAGIPLRRLHVFPAHQPTVAGSCHLSGPFIERIGTPYFLIPLSDGHIQLSSQLRCYSDPLLNWVIEPPCELVVINDVPATSSTPIVSIYPNPVQEVLTIQLDNMIQNQLQIQIIDLFGKVWLRQTSINQPQLSLNLTDLAAGSYILQLMTIKQKFSKHIIILKE